MRLRFLVSWMIVTALSMAACSGETPPPLSFVTEAAPTPVVSPMATPGLASVTAVSAEPFTHTACTPGANLTGQTITLYHLIDWQAQQFQALKAGFDDATAYFNAHGGICGATLVQSFPDPTRVYDARTELHRLLALTLRPVLFTLTDSGNAIDFRDQFAAAQIPVLGLGVGTVLGLYGQDGQTPGWIFATNPVFPDQLGAFCRFVSEHPQQYPHPVIGYLSWAAAADYAAYTPEVIAYCASKSVPILDPPVYFSENSSDISALAQKLIDAGANILYTNTSGTGPALIAKTLAHLGLQNKVTLASVGFGLDEWVGMLGQDVLGSDGLPVIHGMLGSMLLRAQNEADQPGIQLIAAQADQHQRSLAERTGLYTLGWATTDLYIELYLKTGSRVGFERVTGSEIKKTLENLVYSPLGLETIDYHGGTRRALSADRIGQLEYLGRDGQTPAGPNNPPLLVNESSQQRMVPMLVPLSDYQPAPDLRPGGAAVPSAVPTAIAVAAATTTGRIAYGRNFGGSTDSFQEILVMNADGTHKTRLTNNDYYDGEPAWSPDGTRLAYASGRGESRNIFVMNADGSGATNLSNNPAIEDTPAWSPDGQRIAFNSDRDGDQEIYVMNADGSGQTRLTHNAGADLFPTFSPDGQRIAFASQQGGQAAIYIMNSDGSRQTLLTNVSGGNGYPAWSPDGKHIAFVSARDGNLEIYVINVDGSGLTRLTNNPADDYSPAWSPDGTRIAFNSERDGSIQIYVMNADGSDQTRLNTDGAVWPSWTK